MKYTLTEVRPGDADAYVRHFNDKSISDSSLIVPYPYTQAHAAWWVKYVNETPLRTKTNKVIRGDSGELIGAIGVVSAFDGTEHKAEIGYWLSSQYRGKGIMGHAIDDFCHMLFTEFSVFRVYATPFLRNSASHRVLEKAGFSKEGVARCYHKKGSGYIDAVIYSRIKQPKQK